MASIVTRNGKKCTAVPKVRALEVSTPSSSTPTTSSSSTSASESSSTDPVSTPSSSSSIPSTTATADGQAATAETPAPSDIPSSIPTEILPSTDTQQTVQPVADPTTLVMAPAQTLTTQVSDPPSTSTDSPQNTVAPTVGNTPASTPAFDTEPSGTGLPSTQQSVTGNVMTPQKTAGIAGGVVGGIIAISFVAFIIWIWRTRRTQKQRGTVLSPTSPNGAFRGGEKGFYLISRTSLGPTPLHEKFGAIIWAKYRKLRGRVSDIVVRSTSPSPSVNLDRGNSQFGPPDASHSRNGSNTGGIIGVPSATKDQPVDWWGRLAEDGHSDWRLRHESEAETVVGKSFAAPRPLKGGNGASLGSQPDFPGLGTDSNRLEQGMAGAGGQGVNGNRRRSISVGNLDSLGSNSEAADPFSDANAVGNNTTKATSTVVPAAENPFSDSNAVAITPASANGRRTTYVQSVQHSRGYSMNGGISRQASNASSRTYSLYYRESSGSMATIGAQRNKFRSDPFDLDRPDLFRSVNPSVDAAAATTVNRVSRSSKSMARPSIPPQAHMRNQSFTSKYSSGVSSVGGGWSEPGPDVGPAAGRYTPSPDSTLGRPGPGSTSGPSPGGVSNAV